MHRLQELVRLHRLGQGARRVARLLGISPNTERTYRQVLEQHGLLEGDPKELPELSLLQQHVQAARPLPEPSPSSIQPFRQQISDLYQSGKRPQAIYDALRIEHPELQGKRSAIKRLCRRLKKQGGVQPQDVRIVVQTEPGEVAQVDFGYLGKLYDPVSAALRKAWVFVMVLGFSRVMFARIVFNQTVATWLRVHLEAFEFLGGVPKVVVPDNLKAAVIRSAFGADRDGVAIHKSYGELARHCGFIVDPTPPRSPEKKGKVESGVKYLKGNFLRGSQFADVQEAEQKLQRWLVSVCNQRIHGTTQRKPQELFEQTEQAALLPLPRTPFSLVQWHQATVHPDNHFVFARHPYSVPFPLIGQKIWVRADTHSVAVFHDDQHVVTHERKGPGGRTTLDSHLPQGRKELRHRSRPFWEQRAGLMGPEVLSHVVAVFDSDQVVYQLRTVQAIVTLLETYPLGRARAACRRASHFGCFTYRGLKDILLGALDLLPLPSSQPETPPAQPAPLPRFARPIHSLLSQTEDPHDCN